VQGDKLENRQAPIEKDCPVCGHVTLMKFTPGHISWNYEQEPRDVGLVERYETTSVADQWYCYTCGKTFKEGVVLEEVK